MATPTATPTQPPRKKTRIEGYQGPGGQPKCAGCGTFTHDLHELPPTIKRKGAPHLCIGCVAKFQEGMKLCGFRSCLCTDDPRIGTSLCPVKSHRGGTVDKLFDRSAVTNTQCSQCHRCRKSKKSVSDKQKRSEKLFHMSYTDDEKLMWKVAIGADGDAPAMPELRLSEGEKTTHFSSEMAPHKWVEAHKMLLQWEKEAGRLFPKSYSSMDVFWHRTTVVFNRTFDPRPRKYTKEVVQPHLVAVRLLRALSSILKVHPELFAKLEEPTLQEWINVMKGEPLYPTVVVKFCVPLYKSQGRLPPDYVPEN